MRKAPFHLFTFEDENMSLENVTLPARHVDALPFARSGPCICHHELAQRLQIKFLGKEPVELEFKQGEVRFAGYTKTPGVHQIANVEKDKTMQLLAVAIVYPEPGRYTVSSRPAKI